MSVKPIEARPLTQKQKELLSYVEKYFKTHGYSPTLKEMQIFLGVKSISTAHQHIDALRRKKALKKFSSVHRGIMPLEKSEKTTEVPLLGIISAGPLNVPYENPEFIKVPESMVRQKKSRVYALKVNGQSMVEAGILDGDTVLIEQTQDVKKGDIIVAAYDGEVTLKQFGGQNKSKVKLIPQNSSMKTLLVEAADFDVRGKYIGLIRNRA